MQSKSIKIELARGNLTAKNMDIIVNLFEVPLGAKSRAENRCGA
jgi:hypothetical protein